LRLSAAIAPDHRAIPGINLGLLCIAVYLVDVAVRRFGSSPWQALAFSSGFLWGTLQQPWTLAAVLTDFPAVVMAGTAVATVFWVVAQSKSWAGWSVLTLATMAAYQIRPAYLFLLVLIPFLGTLLAIYARFPGPGTPPKWFLPGLLIATCLPLLAFCSFRWLMVDDFGLVSFGGDTSCGLAAELLDQPLIDNELAEDMKPLATAILRERERTEIRPVFCGGARVDMRRYEDNFSRNIYDITYPEARKIYGTDQRTLNRALARYSRAVLGHRRGKYLLWSAYMIPRTAAKVAYRCWFLWLFAPLALLMIGARCRIRREGPVPVAGQETSASPSLLLWTCVLATLFYIGQVSLLILAASYADSRLVVPGAVFLPSVLLLVILREWRLIHETLIKERIVGGLSGRNTVNSESKK